jgi:hypothetical protein
MCSQPADAGSGGIDRHSGIEDVRDALGRAGMDLETRHEQGGAWHARVIPIEGGRRESQLTGDGDSEDDAALAVWQKYLALQDGIGAS